MTPSHPEHATGHRSSGALWHVWARRLSAAEAPRVELKTAHGRVILNLDARDDRYGDLSDVALLVDLGGSDRYAGRVAAVVHPWSSASVLVDVRGDDRYGPDMPDLRGAEAADSWRPP